MKQPKAVRDFLALLEVACPSLDLVVDHADAADGDWWFDARVSGKLLTVFWSPKSGFGFSTQDEIGFGEKPNEIYVSAEMAALRFAQLLNGAEAGKRPSLGIAELRELFGITQTELAKRVGVEQAAISRVEGRDNLELNTLRSLVEAMGLRLSVQVLAPGILANIEPGKAKEKLNTAAKARVKPIYGQVSFGGKLIPSVTYKNEKPVFLLGRIRNVGIAAGKKASVTRKDKPAIKSSKPRRSRAAAPGKSHGVPK
jgi:DNA-binding XRE family transcriptional regulator